MWNFTVSRLSAQLKNSLRYTRWTQRLRKHIENRFVDYHAKDFYTQFMLRKLKTVADRYGKKAAILSATGIYKAADVNSNKFNWDECNIKDQVLEELTTEMDELESLKLATIVCKVCNKRLIIDKIVKGIEYCKCVKNKATPDPSSGWVPFLEKDDIIIWRKEDNPGDGLYTYKIYGIYGEVSAEDFLAMHVDTDYWKSWDSSALSVRTLENTNGYCDGQCVIHWEMMWPKFFSNRDYVYVRRYAYMDMKTGKKLEQITKLGDQIIKAFNNNNEIKQSKQNDNHDQLIIVTSRACEHPEAPETTNAYRVKKYWSNLVIKPTKNSNQPGIEFTLTYFDDPGTNIPSALQTWVAGYGMPDYLARMRKAASRYQEEKGSNPYKKTFEESEDLQEDIFTSFLGSENWSEHNENFNFSVVEVEIKPSMNSTEEFLNLISGNTSENEKKDQQSDIIGIDAVIPIIDDEVKAVDKPLNNNIKSETTDEMKVTETSEISKTPVQNNNSENIETDNIADAQERVPNQNQSNNNYKYWHLWPLYYFA